MTKIKIGMFILIATFFFSLIKKNKNIKYFKDFDIIQLKGIDEIKSIKDIKTPFIKVTFDELGRIRNYKTFNVLKKENRTFEFQDSLIYVRSFVKKTKDDNRKIYSYRIWKKDVAWKLQVSESGNSYHVLTAMYGIKTTDTSFVYKTFKINKRDVFSFKNKTINMNLDTSYFKRTFNLIEVVNSVFFKQKATEQTLDLINKSENKNCICFTDTTLAISNFWINDIIGLGKECEK